jgi:hypothetical protein
MKHSFPDPIGVASCCKPAWRTTTERHFIMLWYYSDILGSLFMFCTVFAPCNLRYNVAGTKIYNDLGQTIDETDKPLVLISCIRSDLMISVCI